MINIFFVAIAIITLIGCTGTSNIEHKYPKAAQEIKENRAGSLFDGKIGTNLFSSKSKNDSSTYSNNIIWKAALDVVSFMPMNTLDSASGFIATDWYSNLEAPNERFRANIIIKNNTINVNAVNVIMFKQVKQKDVWMDVETNHEISKQFEDKILVRAQALRFTKND